MMMMKHYRLVDIIEHSDYGHLNTKLLERLKVQYNHTFVIGTNFLNASLTLEQIIEDSALRYETLIDVYDTLLDDIKGLDKVTTTESNKLINDIREIDATQDSSIRKYNDTPNAGNNPDLLSDKYLTSSDRVNTDLGARKETTDTGEDIDIIATEIDNIRRLEAISLLDGAISNVYRNWTKFIDRELLVFDPFIIPEEHNNELV